MTGSTIDRRNAPASSSPHKSVSGPRGSLKRAMDVTVSIAAAIFFSPVFVLTAFAIWLNDRGPVLYRQTRVGLGGCRFTIVKFRTMHKGAEEHLGAVWSVPDDPRCTRIGGFLRRQGIDELPQLWNIIRGDMSLVGPRPERPEFTRQFRREHTDYELRHTVRPGLTGYAQIHGWRGYTSLEERLLHDFYYVQNWSTKLDLYILLMTVIRGTSERTRRGV